MLTAREQDTLEFIQKYMMEHGRSPLLTEIALGLGISSKGVIHRYISALAEAGYLVRHPKARGIELLEPLDEDVLPLLGRIAAGKPIEAIEDEQQLNFSRLLGGSNRYVLQVKGHSMIDEGIRNGDYVIIEYASTARSNQIIVALIDENDVTLKRIQYPKKGCIRLVPANKSMQAKEYAAERITIQGVLIGQVRFYA